MNYIKKSQTLFLYTAFFFLFIGGSLYQAVRQMVYDDINNSKNQITSYNAENVNDDLSFKKVQSVYDLILSTYYEPVDTMKLLNSMMEGLLENVDPHTFYVPATENLRGSEEMKGSFYGIGIQFDIIRDTIVVTRVLPNGPSSNTSLKAGDRITHVNKKTMTGKELSSKDVVNCLRGDKGARVVLTTSNREGEKKEIELFRGEVPLNSVLSSYILEEDIGYMKIDKFSETTYEEFLSHADKLIINGAQKMILDLRSNGGGYLDQAVQISDELLKKGLTIVSVKGNYRYEKKYISQKKGRFSKYPLVILIDEQSASASEIVAGAMQDNDRAEIVGRPSFGKGLVGEEYPLGDGAVFRVTVAKYFTPSGRCIQKDVSYPETMADTYVDIDSSKVFYTLDNDIVYGGGGIYPDYEAPEDMMSLIMADFIAKNFKKLNEITFDFIDINRKGLKNNSADFKAFLSQKKQIFWSYLNTQFQDNESQKTLIQIRDELEYQMGLLLARNFLSTAEFIYFVNAGDETLNTAINLLKQKK